MHYVEDREARIRANENNMQKVVHVAAVKYETNLLKLVIQMRSAQFLAGLRS